MPARRAMSSVDVPSKPAAANSSSAASSTSLRRSSAVRRTAMPDKLVSNHYLVKPLRHTVELGIGEPGVEREGERPLEGRVGPGEVPLVPVGAEPVERVRPDLALDAVGPELGHDAVAVGELDDVRLPAVAVARI